MQDTPQTYLQQAFALERAGRLAEAAAVCERLLARWPYLMYATDLADIGHYYRQYWRLMAHWKSLFGNEILVFDYDTFVHAPRPAVERLLEYCGLGWDEHCLASNRVDSAVRTASVWQVREPLYQRSSGRWRNYERQLAQLGRELADLLPASAPAR